MHSPTDLQATLDAIVHTAAQSLPGLEHVGVSIGRHTGAVETKAGTDQLVWDLDELQYRCAEGPCLHSLDAEPVVLVNHLPRDPRWPRYIPRAADRGLRAQMGLRLFLDHETLGALNLYSTDQDEIDPDVVHTAELFARHAALALGRARRERQLSEALATRKAIGQAIGMVMERYQLDEDRAFQYLVRVSKTSKQPQAARHRPGTHPQRQRPAAPQGRAGLGRSTATAPASPSWSTPRSSRSWR